MSAARAQARTPVPMRSSGFSDPAFVRIAELAHLFAGLVFPPNRQPSAEAGMRRAMGVLRVSEPASLLRAFETPGAVRDAVLAELTVGESYFFRDRAQLELLITDILPTRGATAGPARPLRVWSAGCASGEEPYTIAIMLREQGWLHGAHILATDIALPRLAAARRGRYTRWALRGVSEERIGQWFKRGGSFYDLVPVIRGAVEFRAFNLVVDEYPNADERFDLILCRNVMIYFDLPTVAHIAAGLLASLAPDGWLVLGASDPPLAHLVACESIMTPAGIAYRRAGATYDPRLTGRDSGAPAFDSAASSGEPSSLSAATVWHAPEAPPPVAAPFRSVDASGPAASAATHTGGSPDRVDVASIGEPDTRTPLGELEAAYGRADYGAAESIAMMMLASMSEREPRVWISYVRSVANQGRLNEAGELSARALELHPLDAELHVLQATLLLEAGWLVDAAAAARRSIYLDRTLVMGHMLLGDALARAGDAAAARIAFTNALGLLANTDGGTRVPAADGVSAARLRQIATARIGGIATGVAS